MRSYKKVRVPDDKEWLTTQEAATIAECKPRNISRKAREGYIERKSNPNHKSGYLYKREDVENVEIKNYKKRRY